MSTYTVQESVRHMSGWRRWASEGPTKQRRLMRRIEFP